MSFPAPTLGCRAPRVRTSEYTPAVLRLQSGDCVTGRVEIYSSTGGLLCLPKPLIRGTRIRVMFLTESGPVLGAAEMLSPVSWTQQPFRFVAFPPKDKGSVQVMTGDSLKVEIAIPEPASRTFPAEPDWINKYRAAISSNPSRRPLLARMLDAITPGKR